MQTETPINWLWRQLDTLLNDAALDALRTGYAEQQRRYNQAAQLKTVRHELALYERIVSIGTDEQKRRYAAKIERRKARIKTLEDELIETGETPE